MDVISEPYGVDFLDRTPQMGPSIRHDSEKTDASQNTPAIPQGNAPGYDDHLSYDTGTKAWLQVLGAFFLWFNSW